MKMSLLQVQQTLKECQRLLKSVDNYICSTPLHRADKHISDALDAIHEARNRDYYLCLEDDTEMRRLEKAGYLNEN